VQARVVAGEKAKLNEAAMQLQHTIGMYEQKLKTEAASQNARILSLVAKLEQVLSQKRPESMGKETYIYEKRPTYPTDVNLDTKLEQVLSQKRPTYVKRDLHI